MAVLYSQYTSGNEVLAGIIIGSSDGTSGINPIIDRFNSISSANNLIIGSLISGTSILTYPGSIISQCFIMEQRTSAPVDVRRLWLKI